MPFSDVIGQERAIRTLRNSLSQGRLPHALLFVGPEGVGRRFTAKILAQAINCEKKQSDACGDCPSCLRIERNSYPDVSWIEPSGKSRQIGIDDIRQLRHDISLKSTGGGKVCIISEADCMTAEASNALLKTLEEPPENSFLILIASSLEHLFSTVTSRCQMMRFLPLQANMVEEEVCKEEKVKVLDILDMASPGATIGEAIPMAERVIEIADCFKKELEKKAAKEISGLTETFSKATIKEIKKKSDADISGKVRARLLKMLDIVLSWYRDVFILKVDGGELLINLDRMDKLQAAGKSFSAPSLLRIMEEIEKTKEIIARNVSSRLAIEVMMMRIIEELKR